MEVANDLVKLQTKEAALHAQIEAWMPALIASIQSEDWEGALEHLPAMQELARQELKEGTERAALVMGGVDNMMLAQDMEETDRDFALIWPTVKLQVTQFMEDVRETLDRLAIALAEGSDDDDASDDDVYVDDDIAGFVVDSDEGDPSIHSDGEGSECPPGDDDSGSDASSVVYVYSDGEEGGMRVAVCSDDIRSDLRQMADLSRWGASDDAPEEPRRKRRRTTVNTDLLALMGPQEDEDSDSDWEGDGVSSDDDDDE